MKNWKTLLLSGALMVNTCLAAPQELDKVVAVVNNGVVLESDINALMHTVKSNASHAGQQLPDDTTLQHQILERLIMDQIILQLGQKIGIQVTDQQIDQAINNIAQQNHITPQQLQNSLIAGGADYQAYRNQIKKEIITSEVRNNAVRSRVTILPQEVDSLAKQLANQNSPETELNLSHILISLPETPSAEQLQKAQQRVESVIQQAHSGADFAKLAITWSSDPQALQGGSLGWMRIEELPTVFAQAVTSAHKGDILGPIRSGVGFHILKVNDIRNPADHASVTEVHARHILLKTSPIMTDAQAKQKLAQIATEIHSGKISFADAAKKYSQDPGSANQGGDLGWANPDIYDPAFRSALASLSPDKISEPVHSAFGWHLLELLGTRTVDNTSTALKDRAYRLLFNRKFAEESSVWMQEERSSAYVKILNN